MEIISDLQDPLQALEAEETKLALREAEESLEAMKSNAVKLKEKCKRFEKAGEKKQMMELQQELESLESQIMQAEKEAEFKDTFEEETWLRCLTLAEYLLQSTTKDVRNPLIAGILPGLEYH